MHMKTYLKLCANLEINWFVFQECLPLILNSQIFLSTFEVIFLKALKAANPCMLTDVQYVYMLEHTWRQHTHIYGAILFLWWPPPLCCHEFHCDFLWF